MDFFTSSSEDSGYTVVQNEELVEVQGGKVVGPATDVLGIMISK